MGNIVYICRQLKNKDMTKQEYIDTIVENEEASIQEAVVDRMVEVNGARYRFGSYFLIWKVTKDEFKGGWGFLDKIILDRNANAQRVYAVVEKGKINFIDGSKCYSFSSEESAEKFIRPIMEDLAKRDEEAKKNGSDDVDMTDNA